MELTWHVSRARVAWMVLGLVVAAFVAFVLASFVGALAIGVFLYYAVRPVYRAVADRTGRDGFAASVALGLVGIPILAVLGYAVLVGARAIDEFLARTELSQLRDSLSPYVDVASLTEPSSVVGVLGGNLGPVANYLGLATTWVVRLFVAVTLAYYLLGSGDRIADWFRDTFGRAPGAVAFAEGVDDDLQSIYMGNLLVIGATAAIGIAVFTGLGAIAPPELGIAFPVLLGLLVGVFTLVPAVGMKIIWVPYAASLFARSLAAGTGLWFPVVFTVVTFVLVDFVPDVFVRSYLAGGSLNMGLLVLTFVLASVAFGWYGIFVGPILLVVAVHFAREILPALVEPGGVETEEG